MRSVSSSKKDQKSLLAFITEFAGALRLAGKSNSKSVGRPKNRSLSPTPSVGRKAAVAKPFPDVRYDLHDHFPDFNEKRDRCRYCPSTAENAILYYVYVKTAIIFIHFTINCN